MLAVFALQAVAIPFPVRALPLICAPFTSKVTIPKNACISLIVLLEITGLSEPGPLTAMMRSLSVPASLVNVLLTTVKFGQGAIQFSTYPWLPAFLMMLFFIVTFAAPFMRIGPSPVPSVFWAWTPSTTIQSCATSIQRAVAEKLALIIGRPVPYLEIVIGLPGPPAARDSAWWSGNPMYLRH